jgi:hypothetical protein
MSHEKGNFCTYEKEFGETYEKRRSILDEKTIPDLPQREVQTPAPNVSTYSTLRKHGQFRRCGGSTGPSSDE